MSNDEMRKRLDRLKAQLVEAFGSSPDGFMAVLIEGGLTPYPAIAQDDQGNEWIRNTAAGETIEDFVQRAACESRDVGARLCTIGGMPGPGASEAMRAAMKAASDYYYENEYPDVPPVEENGSPWGRPSRLGFAG
jgi:hypothetical protein